MDSQKLKRRVAELLGFTVTERGHDAIVEFYEEPSPNDALKVRAVHPATQQEVVLYLQVLGFVARLDELTTENDRLQERIWNLTADLNKTKEQLSSALQVTNDQQTLLGTMHATVDRLKAHTDAQRETIQALQIEVDSARTRVQELEAKL